MKILLVHNSYQQPGGEDVVVAQEAALLRRAGHEVVEYRRSNHALESLGLGGKLTLPLRLIWADGGYAGKLIDWVKEFAGWVLQIVKRTDDMKGFVVLPRRWGVERTFGWLGRCRRLSKDYEQNTTSSEAMILIANDRCDGPETWLMGLEPLVTARAPPWRPPVGILAFVKRGLLSSSRRKRQLDSRRKPSTGLELPPSHSRS